MKTQSSLFCQSYLHTWVKSVQGSVPPRQKLCVFRTKLRLLQSTSVEPPSNSGRRRKHYTVRKHSSGRRTQGKTSAYRSIKTANYTKLFFLCRISVRLFRKYKLPFFFHSRDGGCSGTIFLFYFISTEVFRSGMNLKYLGGSQNKETTHRLANSSYNKRSTSCRSSVQPL